MVPPDQLFKWCCVLLGQKNHTDGTGAAADKEKRTVKVTVDKWNQLKGGDLTIHPDRPRDEELQRLKTMRANGRRELERYARFLSHSIIYRITRTGGREIVNNWKEAGRNWGFLNLFASGDLIDDTLTMVFDSDTADEILSSPTMRRISAALFRLNGNNINAYRIECAALNLFTMDANHGKAQANTLTAGQMLEYTDITKPDENRRKGQDWQKSKRTLENSLNAAVSAGVITGWRYCGTNGAELTPEERKQLETDSSAWESANKMRSKIEANEYKDYILGFMFYKFLSDKEVKWLKENDWTDEYLPDLTEDDAETLDTVRKNVLDYLRKDDPEKSLRL